jgi:hypothetical protein
MNTIRLGLVIGVPALVALTQAGCERRERDAPRMPSDQATREALPPPTLRESTDTPRSERATPAAAPGERAANEAAVTSITHARCDRETRCNNVGDGKKFDSRSDCVTRTRSDWRDDLNGIECPNGVVETQLTSCLNQIRSESCGNPLDTLERALACRAVDLCKVG